MDITDIVNKLALGDASSDDQAEAARILMFSNAYAMLLILTFAPIFVFATLLFLTWKLRQNQSQRQ